jgi:fumarate reductase subunit D
MVEALGVNGVRNLGTGLIIAIVVVGVLLVLFISNLIARVVILVVVIVLGLWVWQQRSAIEHRLTKDKCQLSTTFFGYHVKAPPDVVQACRNHTG